MSDHDPPPPPAATSEDIVALLASLGQLSTAMAAQAEASARTLAEAERQRTADPTAPTTVVSGMIAASSPFAVFGGVPVTTNDIQTVGRTVISHMERASIIDRDQLDKISKKIRRAFAPGFQYIDINKLLESAAGSAIVQPIQLLQDLYIELNNSLAEMESNEIFHFIDWDATGNITSSTNMITHHVADLMAQRVIDNMPQMIQRVQASGAISADAILRTVINDMVFTTYKVLNSIKDPGLRAKVEADLSGHPQNEQSGPLAFFYLMQNVCNLEHDQETEVRQALYKVRLLEFPGANVSQYVQLWRLITGLLAGRGMDVSDGPKAFKREIKTVNHEDFIFDVRSYKREHPSADLNTLFAEAIRLFNKHKGTWIVTTKTESVFNVEDTKKRSDPQKHTKGPVTQKAPGTLKTHDAAGNPIDRKPPGPGESRTREGHIHPHWCDNCKHWGSHLSGRHQAWQERFFRNRGGRGGGRGGGRTCGRGGRGNDGGRGTPRNNNNQETTSPLHMPQNNFAQHF
jgi:uncharacterized membrane protein YgcG